MTNAFLGLGSNIGDRLEALRCAVARLASTEDIRLKCISSIYETEPYGLKDQPWFLNLVIGIETNRRPLSLLQVCRQIESVLGRIREVRWGPRTVDVDVLCYGRETIQLPELQIPHPELHLRRFVLVPFAEIAPHFVVPVHERPVVELLANCPDSSRVEYYASATELGVAEAKRNPKP